MKHRKSVRTLGRNRNQRKALLRSLAYALIMERAIKTTEAKAKELRPMVEKLITRAKTNSLYARRILISRIGTIATKKLITEIAPLFKDRKGGYTRITKLPHRASDSARVAVIEFVSETK